MSWNYLKTEIKKNLLEKVIEENKINFFIRKFFKINEVSILSIYEGLLNNIFELNKNNEDLIKEILTVLKQPDWFFLDNLFSVFRPADETLQKQLFEKLNLKVNNLNDNWIVSLSEPIFSDKEIVKFFENIYKLSDHYENFVEAFFLNNINFPKEILEKAKIDSEDDILNIYVKEWIELTKEKRENLIAKNELKIEKRRIQILKSQYRTELTTKLRDLFDISLQKDIEDEIELIHTYIKHKLDKDFVTFVLWNIVNNYKSDVEKVNKLILENPKGQNIEKYKKILTVYQEKQSKLDKKVKFLENIDKKKELYNGMVKDTIDKKFNLLLKKWLFWDSLFKKKIKENLENVLNEFFEKDIDFVSLSKTKYITKNFIDWKILWEKSKINYLKYKFDKNKKNINLKILNWKFIDTILKNYTWTFEDIVKETNSKQIINFYLYKYQKIDKAIVDNFYVKISEKLINEWLENFIVNNIPVEILNVVNLKIEQELKEKGISGIELVKEIEKNKTLFYKLFVFSIINSIFDTLDKNILENNFKEKEIQYLISKESNKYQEFKYWDFIDEKIKENYYEKYYSKFLMQKEFIEKFSHSFLQNYQDFELFYKNYLQLIWNKEYFKPIFEEFDWISHKDFLENPKFNNSNIIELINKKEKLWKKIKSLSEEYNVWIDFLEESFVKKFNDIFIQLDNSAKIDIIYFINFILTTPWVSVKIEDSFIRVNVWSKVFVFFSNPSFEVMNNIAIFFENNDQEKEKIFILMKNNFYYFLNQAFLSNLNLTWVQQEFKNVLEYAYHNDNISDISIFGSKTLNAAYTIIREWKLYNLVKFKNWSESSYLMLFKTLEKIIENIINLGWAISETKVVDTTVTIGWVEFRTSIIRDWDRIWLTFRKNWHKSKLKLTKEELRKKYNIEYENTELVDASESIPLEASYEKDDIEIMKRFALQDEWIFWIVWKTGSWKSVSIRNVLNYIFAQKIQEDVYMKIITLEDPIENKNLNFTQYNAKWKELMEFIKGIKRADPDILLIWETRNYEMLLDVLEFSSMMWIFTTLHASSLLSTLFLLWQYAIRAEVWLTDVLNQTKVIISQKLLKRQKPKFTAEHCIENGWLKYYEEEWKRNLLEWVFKDYFSSYISEIEDARGWDNILSKEKILLDLTDMKRTIKQEQQLFWKQNVSKSEIHEINDFIERNINSLDWVIDQLKYSSKSEVKTYTSINAIENWNQVLV